MYPIVLELGPVTLYSYGLCMVVAFLAAIGLSVKASRKLAPETQVLSREQILDFACVSLLGGIVGGRFFFVVLNWDFFIHAPLEVAAIWHGGLVWYGGFLGGVAAGWLYVRSKQLSMLRAADFFIPAVALGHAIGRFGCFLNGCCYGRPTDAWCGILFPGHHTPVIPTQLLEMAGLIALFGILHKLQRPKMLERPGRLFSLYLIGYALLRFFMEFLRGDQEVWGPGLTLQQLISIVMFAAGIFLHNMTKNKAVLAKTKGSLSA